MVVGGKTTELGGSHNTDLCLKEVDIKLKDVSRAIMSCEMTRRGESRTGRGFKLTDKLVTHVGPKSVRRRPPDGGRQKRPELAKEEQRIDYNDARRRSGSCRWFRGSECTLGGGNCLSRRSVDFSEELAFVDEDTFAGAVSSPIMSSGRDRSAVERMTGDVSFKVRLCHLRAHAAKC